MAERICDCPRCTAKVDEDSVKKGDKQYCSTECAQNHPYGKSCPEKNCDCEAKA